MPTPILATKLYIPPSRPKIVHRPRLIKRLNEGLYGKLTLISAPAGFGKSTIVSEWVNQKAKSDRQLGEIHPSPFSPHPSNVAWLSLDEGDSDPARFLIYLIAALQTIRADLGAGMLGILQTPQPPPPEAILTPLLNEITTLPDDFLLVLDDYHIIDSQEVDAALTFFLDHLPPRMHLVIATREDPDLPLARYRARGQLLELRAADLRFTHTEAADFLHQAMGLSLSTEDIAALETRTEGWIAGLQLAALALQGLAPQSTLPDQGPDATRFVQSFTGSHRFVMDYLIEEVLHQQPESVQNFLLHTSILNRMCGPLCDAVLGRLEIGDWRLPISNLQSPISNNQGQHFLNYLEQTNLFLIPLDNERRWYRYHHLFADLLRQRLQQKGQEEITEYHIRASQWFEDNNLTVEAFHHAAAANDIDRAERLINSGRIPLHLRGVVSSIVDWLATLPKSVMDARPSLWWRYGSMQLVIGITTGVEEALNAAEAALNTSIQGAEPDVPTRHLIGRIAAARAVLALTRYQADTMIAQSHRALEYLPPENLSVRANANWTLGVAHLYLKNRVAARKALMEAIALSQTAGDPFISLLSIISLGNVQEADNELPQAAETYRRILQMAGDQPLQIIYDAHLGIAHILYEWNDLDAAESYALQSLHLARQYDRVIDRFIVCEVFLARIKLAQGDVSGAAAILAQAEQAARQQNFVFRLPEIAEAQVWVLLQQGNLSAAAQLAQAYDLPLSQARVSLTRGDPAAARTVLEPFLRQAETNSLKDERLRGMVLYAIARHAQGDKEGAVQQLGDALTLAEPGGFIRLFIDEGEPMKLLIADYRSMIGKKRQEQRPSPGDYGDYVERLWATFAQLTPVSQSTISNQKSTIVEPLSERELEVLQLIAEGLSNHDICERLFLALSTVKGHNQNIFGKLQVQRRTEAIARARELGLI